MATTGGDNKDKNSEDDPNTIPITADLVKPLSETEKKRKAVDQEFLQTEIDYKEDLILLDKMLPKINGKTEVEREAARVLQKAAPELYNIQPLIELSTEIIQNAGPENAENKTIEAGFAKHAEFFGIYTPYANNYESMARKIAKARQKSPALNKFLEEKKANPENRGLGLMDFAIKPIQRICKYPLLFRELIKTTETHDPRRKNMELGLKKIEVTTKKVNEGGRSLEVFAKKNELQEEINETRVKINSNKKTSQKTTCTAALTALQDLQDRVNIKNGLVQNILLIKNAIGYIEKETERFLNNKQDAIDNISQAIKNMKQKMNQEQDKEKIQIYGKSIEKLESLKTTIEKNDNQKEFNQIKASIDEGSPYNPLNEKHDSFQLERKACSNVIEETTNLIINPKIDTISKNTKPEHLETGKPSNTTEDSIESYLVEIETAFEANMLPANLDINLDLFENHPEQLSYLLNILLKDNCVPNFVNEKGEKILTIEGFIIAGKALGLETSEIHSASTDLSQRKINYRIQEINKQLKTLESPNNNEEILLKETISTEKSKLTSTLESLQSLDPQISIKASYKYLDEKELFFEIANAATRKKESAAFQEKKPPEQKAKETKLRKSLQDEKAEDKLTETRLTYAFLENYRIHVQEGKNLTQFFTKKSDAKVYEKRIDALEQKYKEIYPQNATPPDEEQMKAFNHEAKRVYLDTQVFAKWKHVLKSEIKQSIKDMKHVKSKLSKTDRAIYEESIKKRRILLGELKKITSDKDLKNFAKKVEDLNRNTYHFFADKKTTLHDINTKIKELTDKIDNKKTLSKDKKYYKSKRKELQEMRKAIKKTTPGQKGLFKKIKKDSDKIKTDVQKLAEKKQLLIDDLKRQLEVLNKPALTQSGSNSMLTMYQQMTRKEKTSDDIKKELLQEILKKVEKTNPEKIDGLNINKEEIQRKYNERLQKERPKVKKDNDDVLYKKNNVSVRKI